MAIIGVALLFWDPLQELILEDDLLILYIL